MNYVFDSFNLFINYFQGTAVIISGDQQKLRDEMYKFQNFDLFASNMVSENRSLPDFRSINCAHKSYSRTLPKASVIIIFHNEPWSTLIRTIRSVVNRSPKELIHEIILVDDKSTDVDLKEKLENYVKLISATFRIIRTERREGLIRARLIGAKIASGSVLVFIDAHMECTDGWLEPLLFRIATDRSVVAVPMVDWISSSDMSLGSNQIYINGFHWGLIFDW